jgi:hypothetical protein
MKIQDVSLLTRLKDQEIVKVTVSFDGSGDDGDVNEVTYYNIDDDYVDVDAELTDRLSNLGYSMINKQVGNVGDWVNNEGGYGYLHIDVIKGTSNLEYYQRTVEEYDFPDEPLFI